MTDNRKSGIALIGGSAGAILTMAVHPTATGIVTRPGYERLALVSGAAHSVGIVSFAILFLGACGLALRLRAPDRLAFAGLVTYGIALIAALIAAAISGFIEPNIMLRMARDVPAAASQWHIVIDSIFQINQAFMRIFTIAVSAAVVLWSISILRNGGLGRGIAIYGCVMAPLLILGIFIGHLRMDVHGAGLIVLAQTVWLVGAGAQLCRGE
ncbi:MAG: hypothetical protein ACM3SQ_07215 [Betaproteobacteria bacterium]